MNKKLLLEVMSVPSLSRHEIRVQEFLKDHANKNGLKYEQDSAGNIYIIKGELDEGEYYPCVVSHIDTVHHDQKEFVEKNERLVLRETVEISNNKEQPVNVIRAYKPGTVDFNVFNQTGIGGDDKCGVFICLELISKLDKCIGAFFVQEEIGCLGSKQADANIFEKVGYAIQFDAPGDNWVSEKLLGVKLYNEEFLQQVITILNSYGIDNYSSDPFTDVVELKKTFDFNCFNMFAGYHNMHTKEEFIILEDIDKAISLSEKLIKAWGNKRWEFKYEEPTYNYIPNTNNYSPFLDNHDFLTLPDTIMSFRAWLPKEEKMYYNIGFINGDIIYIQDGNWNSIPLSHVKVMQSTGKLDSKGDEIYVGDVIDDIAFGLELVRTVNDFLVNPNRVIKKGNIFEDPELEIQLTY